MSLFKKPKKPAQINRRVFSSEIENMDVDEEEGPDVDIKPKKNKKERDKDKSNKPQKSSLLSFGDEEDEGETFQVKKSSFSRRIHKERKKNKSNEKSDKNISKNSQNSFSHHDINSYQSSPTSVTKDCTNFVKEIQSDEGFSIRLKNSNPENLILNGRAALCAGRDDMSSEEEEENEFEEQSQQGHRFSQPDEFDFKLVSGAIPDAAMIHAARKRRQKAREQGEFIALEEKDQEDQKKGKRNVREEDEAEGSSGDEQRVDMSAITGVKELEERREQFYSTHQQGSDDESDNDMNEWENQQIRKGVTGAQLISAQQESIYSHYMIQPFTNSFDNSNSETKAPLTTAELLEQAYSQTNIELSKHLKKKKKKESSKAMGIKTPSEILKSINDKLRSSREQSHKNFLQIDKIVEEMSATKIDVEESVKNGPVAAAKYRFYQELKLYVDDLIECLNEKLPEIIALEEKTISVMGKYSKKLIERRRQDVRDQAKELTDTKSFSNKKTPEDEERIRRAAEREGRRTRRRRDREKLNMNETHNDGMSSDDEVPDIELSQYREQLAQIKIEAATIFDEVVEEYCELPQILQKFDDWKKKDLNAYKEAYVHLCLPKIVNVFVRSQMILWSPFEVEFYEDIDKMKWFHSVAMYGKTSDETEDMLRKDPDVFLIPTVIEKVVLLKLTKLIDECWDPLSTTQTLKLVKLINQLSNDYPSLRITSKNLQNLFVVITDKMKAALDNDVFIPIFQKQSADAKSSFFQRQFYSGVKLFRNFISFQGIVADKTLKKFAILLLLNRYLLSAMRVSTAADGVTKAYTIVLTLPRTWLVGADKSFIEHINMFVIYVTSLEGQLDKKSLTYNDSIEKLKQISNRLDLMVAK
ncbi:CLUMA_CG010440, isoform A [Clunio marinus]|uniref:CLUMA_CG010440, isoform A n=1 Tax=Clunio marinus TaxID=568069 RepID=A0A1J1I9Z3_9DIPT|nr:CLUMA_CG010440, isoform A [Clunio marinus]